MKFRTKYRYLLFVLLMPCTMSCFANSVILVLGDSLSAGYGLAENQGWVSLLSNTLAESKKDYTVVNASVSGETTAEGLQKLPQQLDANNPQIVIVGLGSNDGLHTAPILEIKLNLSKIIDLAQAKSAKILLIGFKLPLNYPPDYRAAFEQSFVDISNHYNLPLVPFLLDGFSTDPSYFQADHLHPTAAAEPIMLANVWKYLAPMLN